MEKKCKIALINFLLQVTVLQTVDQRLLLPMVNIAVTTLTHVPNVTRCIEHQRNSTYISHTAMEVYRIYVLASSTFFKTSHKIT